MPASWPAACGGFSCAVWVASGAGLAAGDVGDAGDADAAGAGGAVRVRDRERPARRAGRDRERDRDQLGLQGDGALRQHPRVPGVPGGAQARGRWPPARAPPGRPALARRRAAGHLAERPAGQARPGTASSGSPPSSRSAGIMSAVPARHHAQSLTCLASRLRHSGLGSPSHPAVMTARFAAPRQPAERVHDRPGGGEAFLHPRHPHGGVRRRQAEPGGELGPGELPRRFLPPEGEHRPVVVVEPAGRLRRLQALAGQAKPLDRLVGEVGRPARRTPRRAAGPGGPGRSRAPA